jgi:IS5 family transposase
LGKLPIWRRKARGQTRKLQVPNWTEYKRSIIKALPQALRELAEPVERALAQVRAVVEHPFHIIKNRFHHKKLRYRGLKKNTAQLHTLFALANLVIVKQALLAQPGG